MHQRLGGPVSGHDGFAPDPLRDVVLAAPEQTGLKLTAKASLEPALVRLTVLVPGSKSTAPLRCRSRSGQIEGSRVGVEVDGVSEVPGLIDVPCGVDGGGEGDVEAAPARAGHPTSKAGSWAGAGVVQVHATSSAGCGVPNSRTRLAALAARDMAATVWSELNAPTDFEVFLARSLGC